MGSSEASVEKAGPLQNLGQGKPLSVGVVGLGY